MRPVQVLRALKGHAHRVGNLRGLPHRIEILIAHQGRDRAARGIGSGGGAGVLGPAQEGVALPRRQAGAVPGQHGVVAAGEDALAVHRVVGVVNVFLTVVLVVAHLHGHALDVAVHVDVGRVAVGFGRAALGRYLTAGDLDILGINTIAVARGRASGGRYLTVGDTYGTRADAGAEFLAVSAGDVQCAAAGDGEHGIFLTADAAAPAILRDARPGDGVLAHQHNGNAVIRVRTAQPRVDSGAFIRALRYFRVVQRQGAAVPLDVVVVRAGAVGLDAAVCCCRVSGSILAAAQSHAADVDFMLGQSNSDFYVFIFKVFIFSDFTRTQAVLILASHDLNFRDRGGGSNYVVVADIAVIANGPSPAPSCDRTAGYGDACIRAVSTEAVAFCAVRDFAARGRDLAARGRDLAAGYADTGRHTSAAAVDAAADSFVR